jgi:hypothetical protein
LWSSPLLSQEWGQITSSSKEKTLFDPIAVQNIPGMIEPIEQKTLYRLASELQLQKEDQFVEFGTFFGRSTFCLAEGLANNTTRQESNRLHAFDSFSCARDGGFGKYVEAFARNGQVDHLLKVDARGIDFFPVFERYLGPSMTSGIVRAVRAELRDSTPEKIPSIALMHIDSPKFFEELKIVIFRFFPYLREGALLIFQDYFYHWSATLIAAVEAMRQMGWLEYRVSAASSLITQIDKPIPMSSMHELDIQMSDPHRVDQLIQQAIVACKTVSLDRPGVFVPRLWLAAYQHLWARGKTNQATNMVGEFFKDGGKLVQPVLDDYLEMMREGFTIRKLYEMDHH